ncbi:MAG TPA: Crp/Fnr family transcriptional regulator [Thermoanaerobaculia bacterium]
MRIKYNAHDSIYAAGETDDSLYLIETGQVKVYLSSASGKDCLLAIYTDGDVFGESCFTGSERRHESVVAMLPTVVRRIARKDVVAEVARAGAIEALLRHLATRAADREQAVFDLGTMSAERRLAKVLLELAQRLGGEDGAFFHIEQRISHEELSQIVGTTRPRITAFMQQFRKLGLIDTSGPRSIRVHRSKTADYLARD